MAPLPILYVNHVSQMSGGERSLLDLMQGLDRRRFTPILAAPPGGALFDEAAQADIACRSIDLRRFKRTRNPISLGLNALHVARRAKELAAIVQAEDIQLIHSNSDIAQIYVGRAGRMAGCPVVWHSRDLTDLGVLGSRMAEHADRVVAISHTVEARLRRYVKPASKLVQIYNGIDTDLFRPDPADRVAVREELGVSDDAFFCGMVAQFAPWKKHRLFLQAAAIVATDRPDAYFLLMGDDQFHDHPTYRYTLDREVRALGLGDRVIFTGYRRDVPRILRALDVVIHPPDREPLGRAVMEAMATAVPVIAVNRAGPAEIIRADVDGYLIEPNRADVMAEKTMAMADDTDLRLKFGRSARERMLENYDLRRQVKTVEEMYGQLCESH